MTWFKKCNENIPFISYQSQFLEHIIIRILKSPSLSMFLNRIKHQCSQERNNINKKKGNIAWSCTLQDMLEFSQKTKKCFEKSIHVKWIRPVFCVLPFDDFELPELETYVICVCFQFFIRLVIHPFNIVFKISFKFAYFSPFITPVQSPITSC